MHQALVDGEAALGLHPEQTADELDRCGERRDGARSDQHCVYSNRERRQEILEQCGQNRFQLGGRT